MHVLDFVAEILKSECFVTLPMEPAWRDKEHKERDASRWYFNVGHTPSFFCWRISLSSVEEADWESLRGVLAGERDPEVVVRITRVCGYYSRVENWNKSKLGELRDRQHGNYAIGEAA